jgi:hypothetical protein
MNNIKILETENNVGLLTKQRTMFYQIFIVLRHFIV